MKPVKTEQRNLTLVIPTCLSNTYIVQNISQNTTVYYIKYYFRATCFDSFESSSGPSRNRSKFLCNKQLCFD